MPSPHVRRAKCILHPSSMTTKLYSLLLCALLIVGGSSCSVEDERETSALATYNALWETLDTRYSYLDLKLPTDSTWRDMYHKHLPKVREGMSNDSLFLALTALMSELKDGHVNLTTPFDYGRYWRWHEDYPSNFNTYVADKYLGDRYRIAGGLRYTQILYNGHAPDSIGYLRFSSFSSALSQSNLAASLSRLSRCRALIIDIRSNSGGNVTTSDLFARHFMSEARTVGYIRHKTGPGHQDFSERKPIHLTPIDNSVRWLRPVVLLTNRSVYSAANDFTLKMKGLPFVTIMGDKTGGGGGLPMTSELPNGWLVRYSSTQTLDASGNHIEHGIEPDYYVSLSEVDITRGVDTMIETAITYLRDRLGEYSRTRQWRK